MTKLIAGLMMLITFMAKAQKGSVNYLELIFPLDSYTLTSDQKNKVDSVLEITPLTVIKNIDIYGHTDSLASVSYNKILSRKRVQSILEYLVYKGADPVKVSTDFYGEEKPKYDNGPQTRFRNRRVELYLQIDPSLVPPPEQKLTDLEFKKGDKIRIPNLNFVGNQPIPVWQSFPSLVELLEVMQQNPDLKIELQGHVCCGDDQELSNERAAMVYYFLRSNNVDEERMRYQGFSNRKPLFEERSDKEKALNRRVEVLVLENSDRRNNPSKEKITIDVEARVLNIAFFPKKSRLMPSGDFMLDLIGKMMKDSEDLFYEFLVYDNIENASLSEQRVRAIDRKFKNMRIKSDTFNVRKMQRAQAMPVSSNNNYITVKIRKK